MRIRPAALVVLPSLCLLACGPSRGPNASLALRRVVLYQNGLGYFERSGDVQGERLSLRFGGHEVDDVLSTLTVLDSGGEQTVVSASVPQRAEGESDEGDVTLELSLPDARPRDLTLTYAVPTPAWRAAYRVVLPEEPGEGDALFQIWALVHNASPENWDHVSLALATASPISYSVDLRTPEFVERPDATGHMVAPTVRGAVVASRSRGGEQDGDGIADASDRCPDDAEDRDGFEDQDGCPDPDNDQDRVLDGDDRCPNEPETYNGTEDQDGCPDAGSVAVEENSLVILEQLHFERGSSRIRRNQMPTLEAIAATLNGNPQIRRVEVQGHASDDDGDAWAVSAERASVVRRALIQRGVAASRLTARPFGPSQPRDPRPTEAARELNRRVEMRVLEVSDRAERGAARARSGRPAHPPARPRTPSRESSVIRSPERTRVTVDSVDRSTASASTPVETEGTTRYDVSAPVSIPAHSSSLVTILSQRVRGEAILLFRPDRNAPGSDRHPFRAARIHSPEATTLIPGPVAIYAGGSFAGEGLVQALHEGEIATLPYAIDGSTIVTSELERGSEPARLVSIARGVLTVEDRSIRRTRYTIQTGAHVPARIFLEHRRTHGHTPRNLPPETEQTERSLLVPVPITPERESTIVVEEVTPVRRQVRVLAGNLRTPILLPYVEATGGLPDALVTQLRSVLERRRELGDLEARAAGLRQRIDDQSLRSAELRQNLLALGERMTDTRRALEQRLRDASGEVERLSRELAEVSAHATEARAALSAAIGELTLEEASAAE